MRANEAARRVGVSIKALRYYEASGMLESVRLPNGYRDYSEADVQLVRHISALTTPGLTVDSTRPFIDCLRRGHAEGDSCIESLVAYRREIERLDALIAELSGRRQQLSARLDAAARRGFPAQQETPMTTVPSYGLPENLPAPRDDGSADHLPGRSLPALTLPATPGTTTDLAGVSAGRWVLFIYPMTGIPGEDLPRGWDEIPGARGCTPEACSFRDNITALREAGAEKILGLCSQPARYQAELVERLHLPYALLSDEGFAPGQALRPPTFEADGARYYQRLTLILRGTRIEHVFFPIFPPNEHALRVLEWLEQHPLT
ncbi:MerR family transcriptional regulator [Deinococcus sp.]|uniref:MerR family transcriptional regulator n=1 Tax=Deinococcus sp. TaxID=47478 RepID=UPI003C7B66A5